MNFAEEMKISLAEQTRKLEEAKLKEELAKVAARRKEINNLKKGPFSRKAILKELAEAKGEPTGSIDLYQWADSPPDWEYEIVDHIKKILIEEGFTEKQIKVSHYSMEPVGSDPLFWHTVYDGSVVVTFGDPDVAVRRW